MANSGPNFDSIRQENVYGVEFWSARGLMPLLGYGNKWQNFEGVIKKAMMACEQVGQIVSDQFTVASKSIVSGKGAKRSIDDYHLSRIACYLIAQNGDPRKVEIAAAQNYFAISTRTNEIHQLRKEQEKRLETRLQVSESFKQLTAAAQASGVQSKSFGIFIDAGYLGLHRHTKEELKARKDIAKEDDYLDSIGAEELSAIDFKNTQTTGKLSREGIIGEDEAIHTHYFVGDQVRKAIEAIHGPMPEDLPSAPSIRALVEERRRQGKRLQKKQMLDEQEKLF